MEFIAFWNNSLSRLSHSLALFITGLAAERIHFSAFRAGKLQFSCIIPKLERDLQQENPLQESTSVEDMGIALNFGNGEILLPPWKRKRVEVTLGIYAVSR